jgi:hypothetical protein
MALARTYQGSNSSTSDATSYTFSAVNIGTGLAVVAASGNAAGTRTVSSITLDGSAMDNVVSNTANVNVGSIRKRAFASATGEVIVTFSSGMTRAIIHRYLLTGYASETASDTEANVSAGATSRTVNIDIPEQGAVIAAGGFDGSAQTTVSWSGATEDNDTDVENGSIFGAASAQGLSAQTGRTITLTSDAASANDCHIVAASWAPAKFVTADAGAFAFTGQAASLEYGREVAANAGSFAFTGTAANLEYGYEILAAAGSFAFTGVNADLLRGGDKTLAADAGSFAFTGQAANLERGYEIAAGAGSYSFTGQAAFLERGYEVAANAGSFAFTGQAVSLEIGRLLTAAAGSFAFTGTAASLERGYKVLADAGSFLFTGFDASILISGPVNFSPSVSQGASMTSTISIGSRMSGTISVGANMTPRLEN